MDSIWVIVGITFLAAFLNGGIGYGFSSVTVPVAILFYASRVLNPALVLVEVGVNLYSLYLYRKNIPRIWRGLLKLIVGLVPAIVLGSLLLKSVDPLWIKVCTFSLLAPLILVQGFGYRSPLRINGPMGVFFGGGIGLFYSITTISGPPLAMMLTNEGYLKEDFKGALAIMRVVESSVTAIAYFCLGLFTIESLDLVKLIIPSVLIAMPLGAFLIGKLNAVVFRRICITIDSWFIAFGLFKVLHSAHLMSGSLVYFFCGCIVLIDAWTSAKFFLGAKVQQVTNTVPPIAEELVEPATQEAA